MLQRESDLHGGEIHHSEEEKDRVVNVPLNLLFAPLVEGKTETVTFQLLVCSFGPRILDARARVVKQSAHGDGGLVEISYDLDIPPLLARMARPFLPDVSVWFDGRMPGSWVGHRMPLFVSGPTVTVVRSGIAPTLLGTGQ